MDDATVGQPGPLARVKLLTEDSRKAFLEFQSGGTGSITSDDSLPIAVGDVLIVHPETNAFEHAPSELWKSEPVVGVVRLKLSDVTILDTGGRWRLIPTANVDYDVGYTVEATDDGAIRRVLSESPVRLIDLPTIEDADIEKYHSTGTPQATFADFGGMGQVRKRAEELIELSLEKADELRSMKARPVRGVLFTGAPGTGKTMLARIVASATSAEFYHVSGPEIFSKWYGQSGEVLRRIFQRAEKDPKAIVFFDEIDSIAPRRENDSHEESKRVVAQLLSLMDGFASDSRVVVIATTNRPQDLDPALRRPGRFDWEIAFPMPGLEDREAILKASSRTLVIRGALAHDEIARLTGGWSAADLTAIWTEAAILAVSDHRSAIVGEDYVGGYERVRNQRTVKSRAPRETR